MNDSFENQDELAKSFLAVDFPDRAKRLAPLIREAAPHIERHQKIPDDVLLALHSSQLFRMMLPFSCGGAELHPTEFIRTIEEIAKADASTAWCIAQASGCSTAAAYLDPRIAQAVFGDPRSVMASGPNINRARAVDGGYRLTGTWMFASGIRNANWLGGHCFVTAPDGSTRSQANGEPIEYTLLFPIDSAMVTDAWDVIGLRGTASNQYHVNDLFVPETHSFTRADNTLLREKGALYQFTIFQIFAIGFAGVALGIAHATLEAFVQLASHKVPKATGHTLRDNAVVQSEVALATAKLESSRGFLLTTLQELWAVALKKQTFPLEQRAKLRLATTFAIHQSCEVVDTMYRAAGATAIFDSYPFERRFRDVHTVSQQVQAHLSNYEPVGQVFLGLSPRSKYL